MHIKNIIIGFLAVSLMFVSITATGKSEKNNIIILSSYDIENEWENSVILGVKSVLSTENTLNIEFLDCENSKDQEYYESYFQFLNTKYNSNEVDYIFTIDDEALDFIRDNLFREDSFCYKKPVFFVGINNLSSFSEDEKKYISGVLDLENSLETVDIARMTLKNLESIYLLIDKSEYSKSLESNISNMFLTEDNINVEIIKCVYIDELLESLNSLNKENSAIILAGTYIDNITYQTVSSKVTMEKIKSLSDIPIYTTLNNYIIEGAIGGVVNDGEKLGALGATLLKRIGIKSDDSSTYFLTPPYNSIYEKKFNFEALREYGINPLKCPEGSIFINKPFYDFLLPSGTVVAIYSIIFAVLLLIIFIIIFIIINKRRKAELKLKYIEAYTREKIKTDSLIIMSHELRTPLNIIMNTTELLLLKCNNKDIEEEYFKEKLNGISKNSKRLKKVVDNAIDVVKLDVGVMDTTFKMCNIIEIVEDVTISMVNFCEENNIDIIFDTNEEVVCMAIDKNSIERIILNLISNAIKSIKKTGKIIVSCEKKEKDIFICVEDNGCGIGEDAINKIFDKYYQYNESYIKRNAEGMGLGLYIVDGLVKLHGGTIYVESIVNVGTKFTIIIPIKYVDDLSSVNYDDIKELAKTEMSDL